MQGWLWLVETKDGWKRNSNRSPYGDRGGLFQRGKKSLSSSLRRWVAIVVRMRMLNMAVKMP